MRIKKSDSNSVFDNMLDMYKNVFNIDKLPKMTFNFNYQKKQYDKLKNFFFTTKYINIFLKRIHKHLYC